MPKETVYFSFNGEINVTSSANLIYFCNKEIQNGKKHIYISFSSRGGLSDSGFFLHNTLKALDVELTFHNTGSVESAGLMVFLSGKNRFASNNSRFLLHQPIRKFPANTSYDARDLSEFAQLLQSDECTIKQIFTQNTSASETKINTWFELSKIFSPGDARDNGIVSAVKEFTIPANQTLITIPTEKA